MGCGNIKREESAPPLLSPSSDWQAIMRSRTFLFSLTALLIGLPVLAQDPPRPPSPPPPAKYKAQVRYIINAARDQHVAQFKALAAHLEHLGFEFTPPLDELPPALPADPMQDVLTGLVPSTNALKLLDSPSVASILLMPPDYKLPADGDQPVRVQFELRSGYRSDQQLRLIEQVRVLLQHFGFQEAYGYDQRGYTGRPHSRLRGTLPAGQLDVVFRDLRKQPSGWFASRLVDLPAPLRSANPVLVIELLADTTPLTEPAETPERGEEYLEKIGNDLWALVKSKAMQDRIARLEILLSKTPSPDGVSWRRTLHDAVSGLFIEGRLGQFVTALAPVSAVRALARLPAVSVVRLPRPPRLAVDPSVAAKGDDGRALTESGLAALHKAGFRGKGVRVAVIDGDFRGFEAQIKAGKLPASTRLVDFTAHRNLAMQPEPYPDDGTTLGHGTHCALAVALAAPDADLTLVRIDPGTPYMLIEVLEWIRGTGKLSSNLVRRSDELNTASSRLRLRRAAVLEERKTILENFEDEREAEIRYGFLGAVRGWVLSPRAWHYRRLAELEHDEAIQRQHERRYYDLVADVQGLRGTQVVTCSLVWNADRPLGGLDPLTRYLDAALSRPGPSPLVTIRSRLSRKPTVPLWLTPAGNTRGQVWSGWLHDTDGDGVLEFLPPTDPLPAGLWTRDLSFLAWQPYAGPRALDLPAKTRIRLSLQWTEPHDPDYFLRPGEPDRYLAPLARLRLTVLRQRDPQAKKLPADDFDAIARTTARPKRLANDPQSSTYELSLEFVTAQAGRYAVQIERQRPEQWILVPIPKSDRYVLRRLSDLAPSGIRPLGTATLPALEKQWQLTPRLFLESVSGPAARQGRPVFRDFATDLGTVGEPASGRRVIAVGAASLDKRDEPYSAPGPPPGMELFLTPRLLSFDQLALGTRGPAFGTGLATPFAAGAAAAMRSAGWSAEQVRQHFLGSGRHVLDVPARR
jgi:hypothetical protein